MTRDELEHAIRAACDVARDREVYVIGSQAILGEFPDAPEVLRQSIEADIVPKNKPEAADLIDGVLGEGSMFHQTHGFYVQGLTIEAAHLPTGWEARTIPVRPFDDDRATGYCLEGYDLAASKLFAFREKDHEFVRALLKHRMLDGGVLIQRVRTLNAQSPEIDRRIAWIRRTCAELRLSIEPAR